MSYLGVLEAVRARLEGNDPKYVPMMPWNLIPNDDPNNIPVGVVNGSAEITEFIARSSGVLLYGKQNVPILYFGYEGQLYSRSYPSITFEIVNTQPRFTEFLFSSYDYGGETYATPVTSSAEEVFDADGNSLGTGVRMIKKRDIEHPLDVMFEVRVYSRDFAESAALVDYVFSVFPPRHFIRVPQKDGSYRSWDLIFVDYKDLDQREATVQGAIEREYAKVITYRVEGYFDNTDAVELVNLIRRVDLQQANPTNQSADDSSAAPANGDPFDSFNNDFSTAFD